MAHIPILVQEVINLLDPCGGSVFVDGTVGLAGHAKALLNYCKKHCPATNITLVGLDRDSAAIARSHEALKEFPNVIAEQNDFAHFYDTLRKHNIEKFNGFLADLGFSSEQMGEGARGFSFQANGPLDMRYDTRQPNTAADIINHWSEEDLVALLQNGGEKYAERIARALVRRRPIQTTAQLAQIISQAVPSSKPGRHPATLTFQALRMTVNNELELLERLLKDMPRYGAPGARVAIITYHSLDDRLTRTYFKKWQQQKLGVFITKKPITPSAAELRANPHSRSAHLWAFQFD